MKKQNPSFEEAMNAAAIWCTAWENGELSDEVLADRIDELLESETERIRAQQQLEQELYATQKSILVMNKRFLDVKTKTIQER